MIVIDYGEISTWTAVWLYFVFVSLVVHEASHYLIGLQYGWECVGVKKRYLLLGGGVQMGTTEPDPRKARVGMVSIAGPCGSLIMVVLFAALAQLPIEHDNVFWSLAGFNLAVFAVTLLPLPIMDGGNILYYITGWRMKWRYAIGTYLAIEALSLVAVVLKQGRIY